MNRSKKHILLLSFVAIAAICSALHFSSCRRVSHNGEIDGHWRIEWMENKATGEVTRPVNYFICIQLEMAQFREENLLNGSGSLINALISYRKGDDHIGMSFPTQPGNGNKDEWLAQFGIPGHEVDFKILKLNCKTLDLENSATIYHCTRF